MIMNIRIIIELILKQEFYQEDLIYNHYIERKELAIKLIEIGLEILKKIDLRCSHLRSILLFRIWYEIKWATKYI